MSDLKFKDADARRRFVFDWFDALWVDDTISSHTVTADSGITLDGTVVDPTETSVMVWLSGGTAGQSYEITCSIVSEGGTEDEDVMTVEVT